MLEAHALEVWRGQRRVLNGVDLSVAPGERIAICGPNGAGKSTLLATLAGDLRPRQGSVTLDGRSLSAFSPRELARSRAVLTQRDELTFGLLVEEVVALGRLPYGADRSQVDPVRRALRRVGATQLTGRRWNELSGGERQRVRLARVLCQLDGSGRYLLLDEPTAALDLAHQHAALRRARLLSREGVGVVAVLHDLTAAAGWCTRLVLLQEGQIASSGTPDQVLDPDLLRRVFAVRLNVVRLPGGGQPVVWIDPNEEETWT